MKTLLSLLILLALYSCSSSKKNFTKNVNKSDSTVTKSAVSETKKEETNTSNLQEKTVGSKETESGWDEFTIDSGHAVIIVNNKPIPVDEGPDETVRSTGNDYLHIPASNTPQKIFLPKNKTSETTSTNKTEQKQQAKKEQERKKTDETTEVKKEVSKVEKSKWRIGLPWYVWLMFVAAIAGAAFKYRNRFIAFIKRFTNATTDS